MRTVLLKDEDFSEFRKNKLLYQVKTGQQISDAKYTMALTRIVTNSIMEKHNANQENNNTKKDSGKKGNS